MGRFYLSKKCSTVMEQFTIICQTGISIGFTHVVLHCVSCTYTIIRHKYLYSKNKNKKKIHIK